MPLQFDSWCFDYPRKWVWRNTSSGERFRVFARSGMPRLHDKLTSIAFYLFPDEESANKGDGMQGTGFLVGIHGAEGSGLVHLYAVTNEHVAISGGCSVIAFNRLSGGRHIHPVGPEDWEPHPDGDDLAILPLPSLSEDQLDITYLHSSCFVPEGHVGGEAETYWGIGDDVFMIGLFTGYKGNVKNEPAVRSGVISFVPHVKIDQRPDRNFDQESICCDMRSVGGFSGSPVIVYRQLGFNVIGKASFDARGGPFALLGIHWGNLPDISEARIVTRKQERKAKLKGHAGISCLVPSWKLWDFLMKDKFKNQRSKDEKEWKKKHPPKPAGTLEDANPNHRADFERLLEKASRPVKPKK